MRQSYALCNRSDILELAISKGLLTYESWHPPFVSTYKDITICSGRHLTRPSAARPACASPVKSALGTEPTLGCGDVTLLPALNLDDPAMQHLMDASKVCKSHPPGC